MNSLKALTPNLLNMSSMQPLSIKSATYLYFRTQVKTYIQRPRSKEKFWATWQCKIMKVKYDACTKSNSLLFHDYQHQHDSTFCTLDLVWWQKRLELEEMVIDACLLKFIFSISIGKQSSHCSTIESGIIDMTVIVQS